MINPRSGDGRSFFFPTNLLERTGETRQNNGTGARAPHKYLIQKIKN
jgi:hypothetical protein